MTTVLSLAAASTAIGMCFLTVEWVAKAVIR